MACQHERLRFFSGDYYLQCLDCPRHWAAMNPAQPEYATDQDGRAIGADPAMTNQGFVPGGKSDLRVVLE